jgi:hypothetical protein
MTYAERLQEATGLMIGLVERSARSRQPYLWTDAFAVCNLLAIARGTGGEQCASLALTLVHLVHQTLGRHRQDDGRSGWLGDASEAHPTRGGLRIGKKLPERAPDEPLDERLEWDRDGQYFHYLTRWMHALDQMARFRGDVSFNLQARELAEVAFRRFSYRSRPGGPLRLRWKMSIDLSRPLVPSMGQHDALEGYVTCAQLRATAAKLVARDGPDLDEALAGFASMLEGGRLATTDPLGIGGLLIDACRVAQLSRESVSPDGSLLPRLLEAALEGLGDAPDTLDLALPASDRLAFRELGLGIGLHGVERLGPEIGRSFAPYLPLAEKIESFWMDHRNRASSSWVAHRDINEAMLASSLVPDGCVELFPADQTAPSPPR